MRRIKGFTMVELLIVIGILVLVLALAVPAFNFIAGSKSTEAANNQLSSFIARARNEAIFFAEHRGVFFYIDPVSQAISVALVEEVDRPPAGALAEVDVYLDLVANTDIVALPTGVTIQFVDNAILNASKLRQDDGYIGFNRRNDRPNAHETEVAYGGVFLFNARGFLESRTYAFRVRDSGRFTRIGALLYGFAAGDALEGNKLDVLPAAGARLVRSHVAYALLDAESFKNIAGDGAETDWQITGIHNSESYAAREMAEENWIDANSSPVLINHYNAALIKSD